jgi:uncharacterized OB-fold protein
MRSIVSESVTHPREVAEFFSGLSRDVLLLQKCDSCGDVQFPPRVRCLRCLSEATGWVESPGLGTIYAITRCHRTANPELAGDLPFDVAIVALDEGVRMIGRITPPHEPLLAIGSVVRLLFPESRSSLVFGLERRL